MRSPRAGVQKMTAAQFIAALQAGLKAAATASAATPAAAGTGPAQVSADQNGMPAPATNNQAQAAKTAAQSTPATASATVKTDLISQLFSWLIPKGWQPAKLK